MNRKSEPVVDGRRRCTKCKLVKPIAEFPVDRSKPSGHTSRCKLCKNKYSAEYYDANAEELIAAELARREGKPRPTTTSPRIHSDQVKVKFGPTEMRQIIAAFLAQHGHRPSEEELQDWLTRYARAGVLGQAKWELEKAEKSKKA